MPTETGSTHHIDASGGEGDSGHIDLQVFKTLTPDEETLEVLVRHRRLMWEEAGRHTPHEIDGAEAVYRAWTTERFREGKLLALIAKTSEGSVAGSGCIWLRESQPRLRDDSCVAPYLMAVYTERAYRRKGVASLITASAVEWCMEHDYTSLSLHASKRAAGVYKRLGFMRTNEMRLVLKGLHRKPE